MEFFKPGTLIDFMRYSRMYMVISLVLCIASLVGVFYPGPNFGTDFVGGTEIQVGFRGRVSSDELRTVMRERLGYETAEVVAMVGRQNEYLIRVRDFSAIDAEQRRTIQRVVRETVGADQIETPISIPQGGDSVRIDLKSAVEPQALESAMTAAGLSVHRVTRIGQAGEHVYEAQLKGVAEEIIEGLENTLGDRGPRAPDRIDRVGPRAGEQLRDAAIKSLLYALAFIMVYVAFRFDLRFAPGGVIALVHDALLTVGAFVLLQREFNLTIVAALLTIVGYSINDTIVVYDRIRENLGRLRDRSLYDIINISQSEMLSRTIITNGTAILSLSAFFIWGTDVVKDLSFAMFIGITVGTYSSIYIAAPLTELMDRYFFSRSKAAAKKARAQQRSEA
jgi:preprotein translocase subunit SecF